MNVELAERMLHRVVRGMFFSAAADEFGRPAVDLEFAVLKGAPPALLVRCRLCGRRGGVFFEGGPLAHSRDPRILVLVDSVHEPGARFGDRAA